MPEKTTPPTQPTVSPAGPNGLRLVFMGTPPFAAKILTALTEHFKIAAVFTQPDKKSGRKQIIQKSAAKIVAEQSNIPIFSPLKLDAAALQIMQKINPDLIIVAAYGKLVPSSFLSIPRFAALNVHPSLLPKLRGASPIQNALLAGEKITGTTIMRMDAGMDTGDILNQIKVNILDADNLESLSKKLAEKSSALLIETIPRWIAGEITPIKQDEVQASYCRILTREDGKVNWHNTAPNIYNQFRAFSPWPGIHCLWQRKNNTHRLILHAIQSGESSEKHALGEVFRQGTDVAIQTAQGVILPQKIQIAGKSIVSIADFLNGYPDFIGSILQ